MKPYLEKLLNENTVLRGFSHAVDQSQLVWHRDAEHRKITVVEGRGWKFQRDNQLPQILNEGDTVTIKAGEYHRLIKGDTDLIVSIVKEASIPPQYKSEQRPGHFKKLEKINKQIAKAEKQGDSEKVEKLKDKRIKLRDKEEEDNRKKNEVLLREYIKNIIILEKKKKKGCKLSKSTEKKIRDVAEKKGYTFGSLKSEYCKGLGAFYSSGSRPGMTAHGWAMARVNKATPSKPWANVKKSKAKKKK